MSPSTIFSPTSSPSQVGDSSGLIALLVSILYSPLAHILYYHLSQFHKIGFVETFDEEVNRSIMTSVAAVQIHLLFLIAISGLVFNDAINIVLIVLTFFSATPFPFKIDFHTSVILCFYTDAIGLYGSSGLISFILLTFLSLTLYFPCTIIPSFYVLMSVSLIFMSIVDNAFDYQSGFIVPIVQQSSAMAVFIISTMTLSICCLSFIDSAMINALIFLILIAHLVSMSLYPLLISYSTTTVGLSSWLTLLPLLSTIDFISMQITSYIKLGSIVSFGWKRSSSNQNLVQSNVLVIDSLAPSNI
jgi:hypothetical protein